MNIIPYEYVMTWSLDPNGDFVVMLNYGTFLKLKKEFNEIKHVYRTKNYNVDYTVGKNTTPKEDYINFNPKFEEITDEIGLWLALVSSDFN